MKEKQSPQTIVSAVAEVFAVRADESPDDGLLAYFTDREYPAVSGRDIDQLRSMPCVDSVDRFSDGGIVPVHGWVVKFKPYNSIPDDQRPTVPDFVRQAVKAAGG